MKDSTKSLLRRSLDAFGDDLGLDNRVYPSYTRQHSSSLVVSAFDACFALTALLETRPGALPSELVGARAAAGAPSATHAAVVKASQDAARRAADDDTDAAAANASAGNTAAAAVVASVGLTPGRLALISSLAGSSANAAAAAQAAALRPSRQCFWSAYDALAPTGPGADLLRLGIGLAIDVQRAIIRQGVAMIKKREVDMRTMVHQAIVDSSPDLALFTRPGALARLASFVQDLIAIKKVSRPLVVAFLIPAADAYIVLGTNSLRQAKTRRGANAFGAAFRAAAEKVRARVRQDGFDNSVVYVQKADLKNFLHQLIFTVSGSVTLTVNA